MAIRPKTIVVTVTTAGTRVQVSSTPIYVESVYFEGLRGNTGYHYVGAAAEVSSTVHFFSVASASGKSMNSETGVHTKNGRIDLSTIWIDASVNGEKCLVSYMEKFDKN